MNEWSIPSEVRYELFALESAPEVHTEKRGIYYGLTPPMFAQVGDIWIGPAEPETRDQKAERIGREELAWETREGWERRFRELSQ